MQTFFKTKYIKKTKSHHYCWWCCKDIDKWSKARADIWKEWKTVKSKYYCKDCEYLMATQKSLTTVIEKVIKLSNTIYPHIVKYKTIPLNPLKWELLVLFPQYYSNYFMDRYKDPYTRAFALTKMKKMFWVGFFVHYLKYKVVQFLKLWDHIFNDKDLKVFAQDYEETKKNANFVTINTKIWGKITNEKPVIFNRKKHTGKCNCENGVCKL